MAEAQANHIYSTALVTKPDLIVSVIDENTAQIRTPTSIVTFSFHEIGRLYGALKYKYVYRDDNAERRIRLGFNETSFYIRINNIDHFTINDSPENHAEADEFKRILMEVQEIMEILTSENKTRISEDIKMCAIFHMFPAARQLVDPSGSPIDVEQRAIKLIYLDTTIKERIRFMQRMFSVPEDADFSMSFAVGVCRSPTSDFEPVILRQTTYDKMFAQYFARDLMPK